MAEWAQPASCTDVRRFVGFANYYCKFVWHFSILATRALTTLCSPRACFTWGDAEQWIRRAEGGAHVRSFDARVGPARPTHLLTDASELAVSAILEQPCQATQARSIPWHPNRAS